MEFLKPCPDVPELYVGCKRLQAVAAGKKVREEGVKGFLYHRPSDQENHGREKP